MVIKNDEGTVVVAENGTVSLALGPAAETLVGWNSFDTPLARPAAVAVGAAVFVWDSLIKDYVFFGRGE